MIRNVILGGDFSSNPFQRGTTFSDVAGEAYTADRWKFSKAGSAKVDISRSSYVPTFAQFGRVITNSLEVKCIQAQAFMGANDCFLLWQPISGYSFLPMARKEMLFRFLHAHDKTGPYSLAFTSGGADRSYTVGYVQEVSGAWESTTVAIPPSPSDGTWNFDSGIGITANFSLAAGASLQTPGNVWTAGDFAAASNQQVNALDTVGSRFRIAVVEFGKADSDVFEQRDGEEERLSCIEYFERLGGGGNNSILASGGMQTASTFRGSFQFSRKRIVPAFSSSAGQNFTVAGQQANDQGVNIMFNNGAAATRDAGSIDCTIGVNRITGEMAYLLDTGGGGYIDVNAEL